jgi:hypothetical protein
LKVVHLTNDEKGIRCNTGAVPAAVISIKAANLQSLYQLRLWEDFSQAGESQKTCHFCVMLSGIKAMVDKPEVLFPCVVNKQLGNEKIINYSGCPDDGCGRVVFPE